MADVALAAGYTSAGDVGLEERSTSDCLLSLIQHNEMPDRGPSKNAYNNGLSYVASKPKFLQNFGQAPLSPPRRGGGSGSGREALPERPKDGKWAAGSDDEGGGGNGSEDEWGEVFGGDADGPQIVVLKEGRHLSKDEVQRERRRGESYMRID